MKSLYLFLFVLLIASSGMAQQRFVPGLKLGLSTTQVHGDTYTGFHKFGVVGGATLTTNFNKTWTAQFEIIYIQKGSKQVYNSGTVDTGFFYYLGLNYLEVPLFVQYHYKKIIFEVGPSFGYLINESEYYNEQDLTGIHPFKKTEIGVSGGISYMLLKKLGVNVRYSNSILSIRDFVANSTYAQNDGQRNNVITFSLTYQFRKDEP